jgi:choline-glycine betaine transporter
MSLKMCAFDPTSWLGEWGIFLATWIAWAPYVGAFIARISRGRTIREFLLGVLVAPSLFTLLWIAVFGATAIDVARNVDGAISAAAEKEPAVALFTFLGEFPLYYATSCSRSSSSGSSSSRAPTPAQSCSAACRAACWSRAGSST